MLLVGADMVVVTAIVIVIALIAGTLSPSWVLCRANHALNRQEQLAEAESAAQVDCSWMTRQSALCATRPA